MGSTVRKMHDFIASIYVNEGYVKSFTVQMEGSRGPDSDWSHPIEGPWSPDTIQFSWRTLCILYFFREETPLRNWTVDVSTLTWDVGGILRGTQFCLKKFKVIYWHIVLEDTISIHSHDCVCP